MSQRATTWLALLVSTIWALSMVINVIQPNRPVPAGINGALMMVLAGVFGARVAGRNGHA